MASNKDNNRDTTAVENLNDHLTNAGMKLQENKKIIIWVILGIILIGAFVAGYFLIYKNPRVNKSWEEYAKVQSQALGNDSVALEGYKKVGSTYGSTGAGPTANVQAGMTLYSQKKYAEAAKVLEKADVPEPVLRASVYRLIGDCYVNLNKYEVALGWFDKAISQAGGNAEIVPGVMMKKANIFEEQKKYQKALDIYEQLKKEYPDFNYGMGMDAYIERAKAQMQK